MTSRLIRAFATQVLHSTPTIGAVEVAVVGAAVVRLWVDEVGVDRTPAAIAEDPRCLTPQRARCYQLELLHELGEVGMGDVVVRSGRNEVVLHQLCHIGDREGHGCNSFPSGLMGAEGHG